MVGSSCPTARSSPILREFATNPIPLAGSRQICGPHGSAPQRTPRRPGPGSPRRQSRPDNPEAKRPAADPPPEKALHQENPKSIHRDSNPTDVFTQPVENKSPSHRHPRPAANIDLPAPAPNNSPEESMTTGPNGRQGTARWRNPRLQPKTAFSRFPPVDGADL